MPIRIVAGLASIAGLLLTLPVTAHQSVTPPAGFVALYNGKDLTGWRGGDTQDHRKYLAMDEAARAKQDADWLADVNLHWRADGPELVNDGKGRFLTTIKEYGDFELQLDYKALPLGDSGIYLRGVPQVQIWDHTNPAEFKNGADKGSGGLWNNSAGAPGKDPLVLADKPFGEWNHFRIVMKGNRVSVWLNEKLTVDNAVLENYYDRKTDIPERGPIELQTHGSEIRWKNIFIKELPASVSAGQKLPKPDVLETTGGDVTISPLNHATFELNWNNYVILVDPTSQANYAGLPAPDLILITDIHGDHLDPAAIAKVRKASTKIVAPAAAASKLESPIVMANGETKVINTISIEAIPMYNLTRGPAPGQFFHEKGRGNGYVLTLGGKRFYIAGDTEGIPEMRALKNIDVAFIPMNLPYTMTEAEAADAVRAFAPRIVYPYHYRGSDPTIFAQAVGSQIAVRIRDWYAK